MNKKRNKTAIIFCMLQGIIILLFCTNVRAVSVKETFKDVYLTFQVWQGSGTSSVSIGDDFLTKDKGIVKFDEFEELQCNEKVVDISNYTIEELNGNTIIILKEEYLKSLTDGTYSFNAVFSKLHVVTHKVSIMDVNFTFPLWTGSGSAKVVLNTFPDMFYPELFERLQYKGRDVDKSNYSVTQFQGVTSIILKEQYVKTLADGEHYFNADFMNVNIKLKLKKDTIKKEVKVKKPVKVKKVRAISKKKKLAVKWEKQKNVTGYIIKIGTNKKITKNTKIVTIKKNKNQVIIRGLKSNKKYYLKVRAYKMVNGKKYWGAWSRTMSKKQIS